MDRVPSVCGADGSSALRGWEPFHREGEDGTLPLRCEVLLPRRGFRETFCQ